jgi:type I restriction enzyme S subunit
LPIYAPPLSEQKRIVGLLDEAFEGIALAKANTEKNLENTRAIFESHLQLVFTQCGPGWVEKRLEEIGKTQTGSTPKTSDQSNYGKFIPFVKPGDFNTNGTLDYDKAGLSESAAKGARIVTAGSVLMVCIGATIGKCGYCDQDVTTNQQVNSLTPSDGSSNRFIYYQMLTETFQRKVMHASGQATLPIINKSKWSALSLWLPPNVAEQNMIAAKLDALVGKTQHLAALYEQKLAALEALKKSLLHQAFSGQL